MRPHFKKRDTVLFYKYLDKAKVYFEYGSGGSTYQANKRENIEKIYSVESDITWHKKLKEELKSDKVNHIYNEMKTKPKNWGRPGKKSTPQQRKNYSEHMRKLSKEEQKKIDLVLIDGRFRVACCLKCYDIISPDCLIIFDDFLDRKKYHVILKYFEVIDKTKNKVMVVLKKRKDKKIPKDLIQKFEQIMD